MGAKPSHKVFFVREIVASEGNGEEKRFWDQIGVAWAHHSGNGFSMKLNLMPANMSDGEIVMLEEGEKPEEQAKAA